MLMLTLIIFGVRDTFCCEQRRNCDTFSLTASVYLMCICKYEKMARTSVCVGVLYECMNDEYEVKKAKGNPVPTLAYFYRKPPMGPPSLMSPFNGRIYLNNIYVFTTYTLWKDLGFNSAIFGTKLAIQVLLYHPSLVPVEPEKRWVRGSDFASVMVMII